MFRLTTLRELLAQPSGTLAVDTETGTSYRLSDGQLFVQTPNAVAIRLDFDLDVDEEFQTTVVWTPED